MYRLIFLLLFFILYNSVFSQDTMVNKAVIKRHSAYLEIFGNTGLLPSINYDYMIFSVRNNHLSSRIGFVTDFSQFMILPLEMNYFTGHTPHHFELGLGITFEIQFEDQIEDYYVPWMLVGRIGYRYQKMEGGWLFRLAFTPLCDYFSSGGFDRFIQPSGGFSVGYSF
jgi:hypothetical protein